MMIEVVSDLTRDLGLRTGPNLIAKPVAVDHRRTNKIKMVKTVWY